MPASRTEKSNKKRRIAASVLGCGGFFDAVAGRFALRKIAPTPGTRHQTLNTKHPKPTCLRGALHVHTRTYSDGDGTVEQVMDAARDAGVDFVLLTDHNTLAPQLDGVDKDYPSAPHLLIGTEITVLGDAFLLALDLPNSFPVERDIPPQQTIDDVLGAGGFPLISLPYDMKHPWEDWDATGYEGLEVLNLSTIARRHINPLSLLWLIPLWRARGAMAVLKAICARPDDALARWDSLLKSGRKMVGIGALDAHAQMKIGRKKYPIPSYADSFRAVTTHVRIEPDPENIPAAILGALRAGRCFFSYDCLGNPAGLDFGTLDGASTMGETAPVGAILAARAPANASSRSLLTLYRDGEIVASGIGSLEFLADSDGAYRLEVSLFDARIGPLFLGVRPWAFTNPVYVGEKFGNQSGR